MDSKKNTDYQQKETDYQQKKVSTVISYLDDGNYAIPTFQRNYEWNNIRIINFLNSMVNSEPFGYIILWETKKDENLEYSRNSIISNYRKNAPVSQNITFLIDGQQRLTTCFILHKWNEIQEKFQNKDTSEKNIFADIETVYKKFNNIYFNLEIGTFENVKNSNLKPFHIKLDLLSEHTKPKTLIQYLRNETKNYYENDDILYDKIEFAIDCYNMIFSNMMGCVILRNYNIEEVIEIFQNINTKGKALSVFDLLHSKWYEKDINLDKEFKSLINKLSNEWKSISKEVFIDAIYLTLENPLIKNKDRLEFNLNTLEINFDYKKHVEHAAACLCKATEFLTENDFCKNNIPSEIIVKWISYFYSKKQKQISIRDKSFILYYLGIISIEKRYSNSTTAKLEKDISRIDLLVNDKIDALLIDINDEYRSISLTEDAIVKETYKSPSMLSRFLVWRLINESYDPKDHTSMQKVKFDAINLHHIFPTKMLNQKIFIDSHYKKDSIINIWPIKGHTNLTFSNKQPSEYILEFKNDYKFEDIVKEIGIRIEDLENDNFSAMMEYRKTWLRNKIEVFLNEQKKHLQNK